MADTAARKFVDEGHDELLDNPPISHIPDGFVADLHIERDAG
jgi:hypothetical protein